MNLGLHAAQYAVGGLQPPRNKNASTAPPTVDIDLESVTKENLATAVYGQATAVSAGLISQEPLIAYAGMFMPLANINLTSFSALTDVTGTIHYRNGIDYVVNMAVGSLQFPSGSAIPDQAPVLASYSFAAHDKVSAFTIAPPVNWVRFEGTNSVNNTPVVVDIFKVRVAPIDGLSLLSDNLSVLSLRGRILHDYSQPDTTTDGRMFRMKQVVTQ